VICEELRRPCRCVSIEYMRAAAINSPIRPSVHAIHGIHPCVHLSVSEAVGCRFLDMRPSSQPLSHIQKHTQVWLCYLSLLFPTIALQVAVHRPIPLSSDIAIAIAVVVAYVGGLVIPTATWVYRAHLNHTRLE